MSALVVGSDLGSSGCKTMVVEPESGEVLAAARRDYPTISRRPGWAEQDPDNWYNALVESLREVIDLDAVDPERIVALSIVGVTHTAVLLDSKGCPLAPSILMFDSRSQLQADAISARWGGQVEERTLNASTSVWTWPQLAWIRENQSEVWERLDRVVLQKDYVRERLGSAPGTDHIDAAGTLLFDPVVNDWVDEFCAELGIKRSALPEVHEPWEVLGKLSSAASEETGLPSGIPLVAGTTDTAAELLGSGAIARGQGIVKLASVGRVAVVSDEPLVAKRTFNYRHLIDGAWYPGTASKYAASAYKWLRNSLWSDYGGDDVYRIMDRCAAAAPPGAGGLIFHPHLDGQWAPLWDEGLRASFLGITTRHGRAHLTRAVLEGVGFSIKDALMDLEHQGVVADEFKLIGQGSVSQVWAQIMSEILDRPLTVPAHVDAAYGAALVAAIGVGLIDNEASAIEAATGDGAIRYEPQGPAAQRYQELFGIYQDSIGWQRKISAQLTAFESSEEISG